MITAAEARKKINDLNTKNGQEEKKFCENKINHAIENGEKYCWLGRIISEPTKKWLRDLGYSVEGFNSQREGCDTRVSW